MAPKMPGKVSPAGNLVQPVGGGGQHVGYALGGQVGHLLHAAHQHDVVHPAGDGHDALAQGAAAAGAGVLDAGDGDGRHAQPVGHDGRGVALRLEQVGRVVADVGALDVVNVEGLVHRFHHVLESLDEQVAAVLLRECAELRQPGPHDGDLPPQRALACCRGHGDAPYWVWFSIRRTLACGPWVREWASRPLWRFQSKSG